MFENLGTALVQALGFFAIFGYFVYQTLFAGKNSNSSKVKSRNAKILETKNSKNNEPKKGLFKRNSKPYQEDLSVKKKGLFSRKKENIKEEIKPKKKGWFK